VVISLVFLLVAGLPLQSLSAQAKTRWVIPTTIGYGGLGCFAGYLVAAEAIRMADDWGTGGERALIGAIGGCLGGGYIGRALGREVDRVLEDGGELTTSQRRGVQLGTVLAGATLATLVSFIHVSQQDGRDTEILTTYALAGAVLGFGVQLALNDDLDPHRAFPSTRLVIGVQERISIGLAYRF
jgi:hypothetical protein